MPKIPVVSPQKLAKALERAGFELKRVKRSHYCYYNSRTEKIAVVPFHNKDLRKGTLHAILQDAYKHRRAAGYAVMREETKLQMINDCRPKMSAKANNLKISQNQYQLMPLYCRAVSAWAREMTVGFGQQLAESSRSAG